MFRKSLSIQLVEPVVYLRGHPKDKHTINILRGLIRLQLSHPALIQSVTIQFVGTAKTLWPEASQHWDKHVIVDSVIPISRSPVSLKRGAHAFPFEILLSNALSESVECGLGHVRYKLLCQVQMKPAWAPFTTHIKSQRPVVLVRLPQDSVPRCITQTHTLSPNGQELHVLVESAHITPGTPLALSFSFSHPPGAINDLCVKLIERQKFRARAKRTTRILHHEITLAPRDPPILDHRLLHGAHTELRCVFAVPDKHTLQLHPSTVNPNIRVRHWIQIALHFTMDDGTPKEVLMDAPVSVIMDTIEDYITLPAYETVHAPAPAYSPSPMARPSSSSSSSSSWFSKLNPKRALLVPDHPPSYDDTIASPSSSSSLALS